MPWFRIDDGFHSHPKVVQAGNAASGLFVRLGSYCSQHLTDGQIPRRIAHAYGTRSELDRLVNLNMIERNAQGYAIPDYHDYNPTAAEVRSIQNARSKAGRQGGIASGKARQPQANSQANSQANASRFASSKNEPHPIPSHIEQLSRLSSVLQTAPEETDDDYQRVLKMIVDARETEWADRITKPRGWRHKVHCNTHLEDGDLIRQRLAAGEQPDDVALMVLGYGATAAKERTEVPWCPPDCNDCGGDGWVHSDEGLAPCPQREHADL